MQRLITSNACYPDIIEWYQIYRNYYYDPLYGGTAKCVKYSRYGSYDNFTTPSEISFSQGVTNSVKGDIILSPSTCYTAKNALKFVPYNTLRTRTVNLRNHVKKGACQLASGDFVEEKYQVIYTDCSKCFIFRHLYTNGVDMGPATVVLLLGDVLSVLSKEQFYPELRSDLQDFQDSSRCYPDIGEWYQIYRNYNYDPDYGGTAKCVKYNRYGAYQNFTTPSVLSFGEGQRGSVEGDIALTPSSCYAARNVLKFVPYNNSGGFTEESFQVIYTDCEKCFIFRHVYVDGGYGCTLWRRTSTFHEPADCCEFIYDENCGTSPKYQIYLPSCDPELGMPGV